MSHYAINTLILLAAAEFAFYPRFDSATHVVFARLGAVYPDAVNIVIRYPGQHSVRVNWREYKQGATLDGGWKDGPLLKLTQENDWINTAKLTGLWPSTSYECRTLLSKLSLNIHPLCPQTVCHLSTKPHYRIHLTPLTSILSLTLACPPEATSVSSRRPA